MTKLELQHSASFPTVVDFCRSGVGFVRIPVMLGRLIRHSSLPYQSRDEQPIIHNNRIYVLHMWATQLTSSFSTVCFITEYKILVYPLCLNRLILSANTTTNTANASNTITKLLSAFMFNRSVFPEITSDYDDSTEASQRRTFGGKGNGSSLDIAPVDSGALQPRKWQLNDTDCSTAAQAIGCPQPALTDCWAHSMHPAGILRPVIHVPNYMDHYSFTDPWGMDGWVGHVGWSIADSLTRKSS